MTVSGMVQKDGTRKADDMVEAELLQFLKFDISSVVLSE